MRKLTLQEHFIPEMTEGILMKSSARVRRIMSVGTMDTEAIFTALLDEVWRVLLMKANARLKPVSSAPNAEKIVCAFLKVTAYPLCQCSMRKASLRTTSIVKEPAPPTAAQVL